MPHPAVPAVDELLEEDVELLALLPADEELDDLLLDDDCVDDAELLRLLEDDFDEDATLALLAEDIEEDIEEETDIIELLELIETMLDDEVLMDDDITLLLKELTEEDSADERELDPDPVPAELLAAVPPPEHAVDSSTNIKTDTVGRWRMN